jgi:excisionase family DNA binding protein
VTTNTDTPLLTVREAATRLNISMRTARRMIKRGDLPALKISGS